MVKRQLQVKSIILVLSILALIYMILNMVHAASFSVLIADDFSHGVGVGKFHVSFGEYLVASFKYAKKRVPRVARNIFLNVYTSATISN
ncbi:hypothetical protein [Pseudobutyrivibrio sp.]